MPRSYIEHAAVLCIHTGCQYNETYLGAALQVLWREVDVGTQQVCLDTSRRLDGHLGAVLEDGNRELWTGHAGQPQAEIPMHLTTMRETQQHSGCAVSGLRAWISHR